MSGKISAFLGSPELGLDQPLLPLIVDGTSVKSRTRVKQNKNSPLKANEGWLTTYEWLKLCRKMMSETGRTFSMRLQHRDEFDTTLLPRCSRLMKLTVSPGIG